jgi:MFS family permease
MPPQCPDMPAVDVCRSAQRRAIATQCIGILDALLYGNGLMLAYLGQLGVGGATALLLVAVPGWINGLGTVPLAHAGDRLGAHRIGGFGIIMLILGLVGIGVAGIAGPALAALVVMLGITLHSIGQAAFGAVWFPLLEPLVDRHERGRFFSRMRMAWQTVALISSGGIAWWLARDPPLALLASMMLVFAGMQAVRWTIYRRIPDLGQRSHRALGPSLKVVLHAPGIVPFGAYLFLLSLCSGAVGWLFGLLALEQLHAGPGGVVALGLVGAIGSLAGYAIGGRLVDRHGCKPVFLLAHGGCALVITLALLRDWMPWPPLATLGLCQLLWGMVTGASSIARTAESMALAPAHGRGLGIGLLASAAAVGGGVAAVAAAAALHAGLVAPTWRLAGHDMCAYDGLLALCAFGVLAITVTLGLVPSVFRTADHGPASATT